MLHLPPTGADEVRGVFAHAHAAAVERQWAVCVSVISSPGFASTLEPTARPGPRSAAGILAEANAGSIDFDALARREANGNELRDGRPFKGAEA